MMAKVAAVEHRGGAQIQPELDQPLLSRVGLLVLAVHVLVLAGLLQLSWSAKKLAPQTEVSIEIGGQPASAGGAGQSGMAAAQAHSPAPGPARAPANPSAKRHAAARPQPSREARSNPLKLPLAEQGEVPSGAPGAARDQSLASAAPSTSAAAGQSLTGGSRFLTGGGAAGSSAAPTAADASAAYLHNPKPAYPLLAYRSHIEGTVVVRALVNPDGSCATALVGSSSGSDLLDVAAVSAVTQWKFVPATRSGQPIQDWVNIPITFSIRHR